MDRTSLAILVTIGFSAIGILGDYYLKRASEAASPLTTAAFYIGFVIYSSTAFGWVFVMKYLKLSTIGVVYSVTLILLLTALGTLRFGETLSGYEIAGIAMAIGALVLLMRFA